MKKHKPKKITWKLLLYTKILLLWAVWINSALEPSLNKSFAISSCHNYYFSSSGSDSNSGSSPDAAWRSLKKINQIDLQPCDQVLLKGGDKFVGGINLDANDSGSPKNPVIIKTFGSGQAKIDSGTASALKIINAERIIVKDLILQGAGRSKNNNEGILIFNNTKAQLNSITLKNLNIYGYNKGGITIGEWDGMSGYHDIDILDNSIHHNGSHGINVYGYYEYNGLPEYSHDKITIRGNTVYSNHGEIGVTDKHTGSGIIVGNSSNILIGNNKVYNNGKDSKNTTEGPCGIWVWESRGAKIQYNESFQNRTGGLTDGCGFNLDGGVSNSLIQYNFSHNNQGSGFQLSQYSGASDHSGNIIRYNVSSNDGRRNNTAGLLIWRGDGVMKDLAIYHNTIYREGTKSSNAALVSVISSNINNTKFFNNILAADDNSLLLNLANNNHLTFINNNFSALDGNFLILQGKKTFNSISSWQKYLGMSNTNYRFKPLFESLSGKRAFQLSNSSKLKDLGYNSSTLGETLPTKDFYKNSSVSGNKEDIGAHELPR